MSNDWTNRDYIIIYIEDFNTTVRMHVSSDVHMLFRCWSIFFSGSKKCKNLAKLKLTKLLIRRSL